VVRSYIEHSLGAKQGLVKVWYAGPMFRQERPQAGRYRQFYQFGVEAIGSLDPALDAEVIAMNFNIIRSLGISDMKLYINSIGMPAERKSHKQAFSKYVQPKIDKFCGDCRERFKKNPLRMFDCKKERCRSLLTGAPTIFDYLSIENREHFDTVRDFLAYAGIPFEHDKTLVRGLDYYTRTTWEIVSGKLGSQDSLSGGGRYDLLVEQFGGDSTPGIGFAAGMERILLAMPPQETGNAAKRFGFFIAVRDSKFMKEAFKLAMKIRSLGVPADIDYLGRSLKAQMKMADKSGYVYCVILAEEEMARGKVVIRTLIDSRQGEIDIADIMKIEKAKQLEELMEKTR
jgi:histidyl-tRNA synthetase